ncbi:A/G-specific DNA-adenine glycosylase [Chitinophaga niastensis]|uniref:Adenine DNA glycosylase n=1 Tax=Chitinophaga niastensis TaxID=536980 RepID=A0A2P8HS75_CHINA|nr:A/G-specific adenine glycosylase [Chitinophaga niastensis]PSL49089.1 A/G-specific DNA-adenine glycosylase [Chitinophaga niastensis]
MISSRHFFTETLLEWNRETNTRNMPWKGEKNPYRIWLSEIILQQTRVEQGWPYYERFIKNYPTVKKLAAAPEEEVFRLWQGLGYYARCKNMLAAAREITNAYNGTFPNQYDQIKALKGIGPYTAAAIASFAFNLPHAVLDGNVFRVLSRYFGIETPIDTTAGKKQFEELAGALLLKDQAAAYNQSIMDFGAVVCKPQQPVCSDCPLNKKCVAYHQQLVALLPIKSKKLQIKKRYFNYLLVEHKEDIYIRKRTENDIWQNLHEFILIETPAPVDITLLQTTDAFKNIFQKTAFNIERVSAQFKQQLTHQTIHSQFITISLQKPLTQKEYMLVPRKTLNNYAFPKTITTFLESNHLQLF